MYFLLMWNLFVDSFYSIMTIENVAELILRLTIAVTDLRNQTIIYEVRLQ